VLASPRGIGAIEPRQVAEALERLRVRA